MELHFTATADSKLLKTNLENMTPVAVARVLGEERPRMGLADRMYIAKIIKEVHRLGVIRGRTVNAKA